MTAVILRWPRESVALEGRKAKPDEDEERVRQGEMGAADTQSDLRLAARLIELWRLCAKTRCRRAHACRGDLRRCSQNLADWHEALSMKDKRIGFDEAMQALREQSG
jgi:hypothetical protein